MRAAAAVVVVGLLAACGGKVDCGGCEAAQLVVKVDGVGAPAGTPICLEDHCGVLSRTGMVFLQDLDRNFSTEREVIDGAPVTIGRTTGRVHWHQAAGDPCACVELTVDAATTDGP